MAFTGGPLYLRLLHAAVAITMPSRGTYPTLTYNLKRADVYILNLNMAG